MDWLKFYGLKGEPFGPQPLRWPDEFQNVFVLTEIVKTEVDPIISTIMDSERYLYLISGERGAGKSTLMHYIINEIDKVGNILPVDVSVNKKSYKGDDPGYALQVDLTYSIAKKIIDAIMNKYEILSKSNYKLFDEYRQRLTSVGSNLDVPGDILQKVFSLLSQEKIVPIVFIDNLDKIDQKEALHFLKLPYAQSLFENFFFVNRVRIFLVADQSWLKELVHPDFSYLGRPIIIKSLNFAETQNLIQKKMRKKASNLDDFKFPFNEESIVYITKIADGNPRKIQDKCTTALIEGAQHNIKIIDLKFLQQIQNDLGKEFESIKDLLIQYPEMERNLAWLLEVRGKFKDNKSFEEALFNTLNLQKGNELGSATIDQLRNCELISFSLEKLDEAPKYRINPLFENLIGKIRIKMSIDVFIKWFSRTEAEVISISPAKSSILEELEIVCDSLPEPKKGKAREALKNYALFRKCRLEDDDRNECIIIAHNVAKDLIGIIAPEILTIEDFTRLREVLKSKISKEVISDFFILNSYFSGNNNLNLSFSDIAVISEKLNNIIENIIDPLDKIIIKKVPFFFADSISFGNFVKKRLLNPGLLFLSPEQENLFDQFCICWVSESPIYGPTIYGLSIAKDVPDYFDDALSFYAANYQYIPYPIQGLLRANGLSPDKLQARGGKIRIAYFYELSLILNRIITKYSKLKMIFIGYSNLSLWTASVSGTNQKIQMMEEGTIEQMPLLYWLSKYSNQNTSSETTMKTERFSDIQIDEILEPRKSDKSKKDFLSIDEKLQQKNASIEQILDKWGFRPGGFSHGTREQKKADIEKWLRRFLPSEFEDAFLIMEQIQYHDSHTVDDYMEGLSRELKKVFNDDLSEIIFYPLGESPASSGGNLLYSYRKHLGLPESSFPYVPFKDIDLSSKKAIVFFDDIIGSGNQAVRFAEEHLKNIKIDKYYIALMAFEKGLEKVRNNRCFKNVIVHETISEELQAFSPNSQVFPDVDTRERVKRLCEKYGKLLYPKYPLGYDDSQALIVFPHNTPNNSLPIIWASDKNEKEPGYIWYPLWERIKRTK